MNILEEVMMRKYKYQSQFGINPNILLIGSELEAEFILFAQRYGFSGSTIEGCSFNGLIATVSKSIQHGIAVTRMEQLT